MFWIQKFRFVYIDTEADPLEERIKDAQLESYEELTKRVTVLEKKVDELISLEEKMQANLEGKVKKGRRKYSEMIRSFEVSLLVVSVHFAEDFMEQKLH